MGIPASEWRWFGRAGHHICASDCLHHLHTRVGDYRISTVGDMVRDRKTWTFGQVGLDREFETYVFKIAGECEQCDPPCGHGEVVDWNEIDSLPANSPAEAEANHMALCQKYAEAAASMDLRNGETLINIDGVRALDAREDFVPVSERLRLHYIEGAHAGLRGEWARIIREETAMLAEVSRRYRRYRRDMRDQQRVGQYLPWDHQILFHLTRPKEMPF